MDTSKSRLYDVITKESNFVEHLLTCQTYNDSLRQNYNDAPPQLSSTQGGTQRCSPLHPGLVCMMTEYGRRDKHDFQNQLTKENVAVILALLLFSLHSIHFGTMILLTSLGKRPEVQKSKTF